MSVHRLKPLPTAMATCSLTVTSAVADRTLELLRQARYDDGPHEAMVWWLGKPTSGGTLILACHQPATSHGRDFVFADEAATGVASRLGRQHRLGVLAQVHSHPGDDTRHSDGDDDVVLMPYEGMFSLVVSRYGSGSLLPEEGAGLHQFQDSRWVLVPPGSGTLRIATTELK